MSKLNENVDEIDESALDSLKPGARSVDDPKSKIEAMTAVLGAMHGMKKEDLTKWFHQAMDLIGHEADSIPDGASAKNTSSVDASVPGPKTKDAMPKLSVKEDVEAMFADQDLSEEFKERAATVFEAAVGARIYTETARLEGEFEAQLEESLIEITEGFEKKLDTYLDYVVENWMKKNEVAIESSLRNEVMDDFIGGLKNLFKEHYIDVPEEKVNVVEELNIKVAKLENALDESLTENQDLKGVVSESKKKEAVESLSEGLTVTEAEKFSRLSEGVDFDGDLSTYTKKLTYVKETYFAKGKTKVTKIEESTFEGDQEVKPSIFDPEISKFAAAITRTVKK